jgi:hypothetical protein
VLDRLVGRPVLTDADAVVGVHPDRAEAREGREADGRSHVVREDEERRAVGNEAAVVGHAVDGGAHPVLADTEVDVAPGEAPDAADRALHALLGLGRGREITLAFEPRERRWVEVRRAAHQLGQLRGEGLHHTLGGLARGHALGVGRE